MDSYVVGGRKEDVNLIRSTEALPKGTAKEFLRNTIVRELFPENRTKIISVDKNDPVSVAFKILSENKIQSVPVFDEKAGQFTAFIDMLDIVCHCLNDLKDSDLTTSGDFETILCASNSLAKYTCGQVAGSSGRNQYYPIEEHAPLMTAIQLMLENRLNRLPAVATTGELTTIITQSHVLSLIKKNISKFSIVRHKTIDELQLGIKRVLSVKGTQTAIDAFKLIYEKKVLGVAVVDENNRLMGNISASDLRQIGSTHLMSRLLIPTVNFLELIPKPTTPVGPVQTSTTVDEIVDKLVASRTHRIYVTDKNDELIGVISLIDLLDVIMQNL